MSESHFNGYRLEASEKRAQAQRLLAEAEALEAHANKLDPDYAPAKTVVKSSAKRGKNGQFAKK